MNTMKKKCLDSIGPYKITWRGNDPLILRAITMIDPITGWFERNQYNNNKSTMIANLVDTMWLVTYTWPVDIMHD